MVRLRLGPLLLVCAGLAAACGLSLTGAELDPGDDASLPPPLPSGEDDAAPPPPPLPDALPDRQAPPDSQPPPSDASAEADAPFCLARTLIEASSGEQLKALCQSSTLTCENGAYDEGDYFTNDCGDAGACVGFVQAMLPANHFEISTTFERSAPGYDALVLQYTSPLTDAAAPEDAGACANYAQGYLEVVTAVYSPTGWKLYDVYDLASCQRFFDEVLYGAVDPPRTATLHATRDGNTLRAELLGTDAPPIVIEAERSGQVLARLHSGTVARSSVLKTLSFSGCSLEQ